MIKDLCKHVYSHEPLNLLSDDNSEYESDFSLPDPFGQSLSEGNALRRNETFPANNANDTTTRDLHLNSSAHSFEPGNDWFWQQNITQVRKSFITHSKLTIF